MDFVAVVDQAIALLRQRSRLPYGTLKRQFQLDDAALADLKEELIYGQRLAVDEDERVLVWIGDTAATTPPASGRAAALDPSPARAALATAIALYRDMEMTFWLPQAEAALVQVG